MRTDANLRVSRLEILLNLTMKYLYTVAWLSASMLMQVGCGGKEDASVVALPPPPATADVSLAPATPTAATDGAPGTTPPPTETTTIKAEDEFKGMSPKDIEAFKKGATPETHDVNYSAVSEGALAFFNEYGRAPQNVEQIAKAGFIRAGITAPKGKKYVIDPKTLSVSTVDQ
jgi:hypothetical protein